jgi:hypothetical protein
MSLSNELRIRWCKVLELLQLYDARLLTAVQEHHSWESDADFERLLTSNALWGGAGSIADQAGSTDRRTPQRREIESALIDLGSEQLRVGVINQRTAMWVDAFRQWSQSDI